MSRAALAVLVLSSACSSRGVAAGATERGEKLVVQTGCGACHRIPGVRGAAGVVGPPLDLFARRTFISGRLPNQPENLVRWLKNPRDVDPETAMPDLKLDDEQARDVAAFLYTLN